ncbi:hypothetical protein BC332_09722 [Capsicum chinense]|nr:hypothetical protein BC332_09722 [Capsicum chinense]
MFRERVRRVIQPPAQENIDKLEKVVKEGNYYGAQQMYKSTSARYASAERYSDALNVLQSGACLQLDKAQITCGAELSLLFAETLAKSKVPYDEGTLGLNGPWSRNIFGVELVMPRTFYDLLAAAKVETHKEEEESKKRA